MIFRMWAIKITESQIARCGKDIAARLRVYRLRWCVFAGWVVSQRAGSKIRRQAIQRLEGNDLVTSYSHCSLH